MIILENEESKCAYYTKRGAIGKQKKEKRK
jgi:hypothetical protein